MATHEEAFPDPRSVTLKNGHYTAQIYTRGASIKQLEYQGRPLVDTYPDGAEPPLSAGVVLAPWPNRTEDGSFTFGGTTYQLELTEPDRRNAIHGFAITATWEVTEQSDTHATLEYRITPRAGWPWTIDLRAEFSLDDNGLRATYTAAAEEECPFGFGVHTYLNAHGAEIDECTMTVPVDTALPLDSTRNLPAGPEHPAQQDVPGIATGAKLGQVQLDHCFHATAPAAGAQRITRLRNASGAGVEMLTSENLSWFQIFTADPRWECAYPGRGRALAIEPMSCPPNALRSGEDVTTLTPGQPVVYTLQLRAC